MPLRILGSSDMNEILYRAPQAYKDAQVIEHFREGIDRSSPLARMRRAGCSAYLVELRQAGLSVGLHGRSRRVTAEVFLLPLSTLAVSGRGEVEVDIGNRRRRPSSPVVLAAVTVVSVVRHRSSQHRAADLSGCSCWRGWSSTSIRLFARRWRRAGPGLVVASAVFALSPDPPIKPRARASSTPGSARQRRAGSRVDDRGFARAHPMWIVGGFR